MTFASLEFDRVLALVASFARSARGRAHVLATLPRFDPAEGSLNFERTREVGALIDGNGALGFAGLDAAELVESATPVTLEPAECLRLMWLVRNIVEVRTLLGATEIGPELRRSLAAWPELDHVLAFCEQRLGPGGEVLDSASPQLAQARAARERHRRAIVAALEELSRNTRGLSAPYTVRRERYCIPVPIYERQNVPGLVLDVSASAATVFLEPFAVVERNNALAEAISLAQAEEERVLAEIAATFARHRTELIRGSQLLTELDADQARALFGRATGGRLVEPGCSDRLHLLGARHPLLDPALAKLRADVLGETGSTRPIVPLDLELPEGARLVLLSGPNAGGKTVALKTLGLTTLMAASGIPVLVDEGAALPPVTSVWCHIGDEQNLLSDLSTFTGAMKATTELLANADPNTLVLYDELGSGTDPEEGAALAAALLEELARRRCWTVATAHLVTVAAHLEQVPGSVNAAMGYDESSGRPTFRLQLGVPGRSRGLAIASACGVPAAILERARSLVSRSYLAIDTYLASLQGERERCRAEQESLRALQDEAVEAARAAAEAAEQSRVERDRIRKSLDEERERLRRRANERLDAALAELALAKERGELPGKRRVVTLRRAVVDDTEGKQAPAVVCDPFGEGAHVRLRGSVATGVVRRVVGNRVEVQAGDKRLWVERSACEAVAGAAVTRTKTTVATDSENEPSELKLIGMTQDDARDLLEHFLDHAVIQGQRHVRIVHGHGTGTLRRMVWQILKQHPAVVHFAHPGQNRGGTGATEAELE